MIGTVGALRSCRGAYLPSAPDLRRSRSAKVVAPLARARVMILAASVRVPAPSVIMRSAFAERAASVLDRTSLHRV